jgi:superoxide dismutase, Fe-Mn family
MHTLPALPYAPDALEPWIDTRTMEIHHGKHHAAYVSNLNVALERYPNLQNAPLERLVSDISSIPEVIRTTFRDNGGGHLNHSFFWTILSPKGGGTPKGSLSKAIDGTFGSFTSFQQKLGAAALSRFGSGWAWLSCTRDGLLLVHSTPNQDSPFTEGYTPIVGIDVWEHAYYLKYQNRRSDYLQAWWNVVNWDQAEEYYRSIK